MTNVPAIRPQHDTLPALLHSRDRVKAYVNHSMAANTQRAYKTFWEQFKLCCEVLEVSALPASADTVAGHLSGLADEGKSASTINTVRAAIGKAHQVYSIAHPDEHVADPTQDPLVKQTVKGIRATIGTKPEKKAPTLPPDIRAMLGTLDLTTLAGVRDKALLLLGFYTASRRSELSAFVVADLVETVEGFLVTLRKSKTDQEGAGYTKGVKRRDNPDTCPVRAVRAWLTAAGITDGPLFREVKKGGRVQEEALTGHSIARIIKRMAKDAQLDETRYSGHSMRAGLVTTAAKKKLAIERIMEQTGHKSYDTVRGYYRDARILEDSITGDIDI